MQFRKVEELAGVFGVELILVSLVLGAANASAGGVGKAMVVDLGAMRKLLEEELWLPFVGTGRDAMRTEIRRFRETSWLR